jgi:hypothetical protein
MPRQNGFAGLELEISVEATFASKTFSSLLWPDQASLRLDVVAVAAVAALFNVSRCETMSDLSRRFSCLLQSLHCLEPHSEVKSHDKG